MATYNGEKYVREQLESIWSQSVKPDEIIISDDASTDNTISVIEYFIKQTGAPVTLIENSENHGFIKNFHTALSHANGDIIFLSDQDDLWLPDRIAACKRIFDRQPEVLSLSCGLIVSDGTAIAADVKKKDRFSKVPLSRFLRYPHYPGMAMALRKELVKEMLACGNTDAVHDWLLNYLAAKKGGMYYLDTPLVIYRQHKGNTIGSLQAGSRKDAAAKRASMLLGINRNLSSAGEDTSYVRALAASNKKRAELLDSDRPLPLLLHDLTHLSYVSLKSSAGDIFALQKVKTPSCRNQKAD